VQFDGDAPVNRRSKIRSPGGCLDDRLRRAIDRLKWQALVITIDADI